MEEEKILLKILFLSFDEIFKKSPKLKLTIKSVLIVKNEIPVVENMFKINIKGSLNADLIVFFNSNLKKAIANEISSLLPYTENINGILDDSIIIELLNLLGANIINYLGKSNINLDISTPEEVKNVKYLYYQKVLSIIFNTHFGEMVVHFGINRIYESEDINFLLVGFDKNFTNEFIVNWIKKGITVLYSQNLKDASKIIRSIKINLCIIDYNLIENHIVKCLEILSDKIDYFLNYIIACTKNDLIKIKNINYFSPYSQILGVFLKNQDLNEINTYINKLIEDCGIRINEKRRYIRVKIKDDRRYFVSFYKENVLIKGRILDLSLVGAKISFDNEKDSSLLKSGDIINNVELFLNYNHLIFDCTIINVIGREFSILFNNVTHREEEVIAKIIFNLLPHCEKFKEICEDQN
ncbi:MAG: PilZ domain-containing protein [Spirochaetes bacterium]|nr:PilZ domain-containing protein [Spirochaetota bacterium]